MQEFTALNQAQVEREQLSRQLETEQQLLRANAATNAIRCSDHLTYAIALAVETVRPIAKAKELQLKIHIYDIALILTFYPIFLSDLVRINKT
jgi:hypothetical protein